ncbi:hypothetical protein EYF80_047144 [Liparis tanakae]|uniref:Uncharacterized protein n=1 Tax=Liparis tanakae TaxID=230148 RepID=A0A4Z2FP93_9TELE|nr:hypothetical protein EYF80_047144 [Liparis tanakae]
MVRVVFRAVSLSVGQRSLFDLDRLPFTSELLVPPSPVANPCWFLSPALLLYLSLLLVLLLVLLLFFCGTMDPGMSMQLLLRQPPVVLSLLCPSLFGPRSVLFPPVFPFLSSAQGWDYGWLSGSHTDWDKHLERDWVSGWAQDWGWDLGMTWPETGLVGYGETGLVGYGETGLVGYGETGLVGYGETGLVGFGERGGVLRCSGGAPGSDLKSAKSANQNTCCMRRGSGNMDRYEVAQQVISPVQIPEQSVSTIAN